MTEEIKISMQEIINDNILFIKGYAAIEDASENQTAI